MEHICDFCNRFFYTNEEEEHHKAYEFAAGGGRDPYKLCKPCSQQWDDQR